MVARIDQRLAAIQKTETVGILLAVESGSRAWGFPSPDSDYDCRFMFVRSLSAYLSLFPHRDVIESPLDPVLDVNGWDLAKTLKLLLKGNAVAIEWLTSPYVYGGDPAFKDECLALARMIAQRPLIANHYYHLGESIRRKYLQDAKSVRLKKLFYAVRPALALRWLRRHPGETVPPMNIQALMSQTELPASLTHALNQLIVAKAATREMGVGPAPREIVEFLEAEYALAASAPQQPAPTPQSHMDAANAFFQRWVCKPEAA
ncbi:MAG: nucleotidyltransferase domain-containing protein [Hyphomicrobiales bacterium]|nr:nucleotidyltransferase domain-containing protein [Hyphomicrobiales bacterium]